MVSREVGQEKASDASDSVIYKIEVPANRSVDTERALFYHYLRVRLILTLQVWSPLSRGFG